MEAKWIEVMQSPLLSGDESRGERCPGDGNHYTVLGDGSVMFYGSCYSDCKFSDQNYCRTHKRPFEKIEDRSEFFEHENADSFGCPSCYCNSMMEA